MDKTALPTFRPTKRIGQFPMDEDSKFGSKEEAELYAQAGRSHMSSAYPQQIISVKEDDHIGVYVIDDNYNLAGISNSTSADLTSYVNFSYNDLSGALLMTLDKDFYLQSLTVSILETFDNDSAFTIGTAKEEDRDNYVTKYFGENDLITNEIGSYRVFFNKTLGEPTTIRLWFGNGTRTRGRATLKVN